MLIEGATLLEEALAAGATIRTVAVTRARLAAPDIAHLIDRLEGHGAEVVQVSDAVMGAMSPVRAPSGIAALGAHRTVDRAAVCAGPDALVVALVHVQDPGNVGAVLRAAEAGGATAVITCGETASPWSWKALRGSMGSAFRLPLSHAAVPAEAVDAARSAGLSTLACVQSGGDAPAAIDFRRPTMVFLGAEGAGLPPGVLSACDRRVSIPMRAPVESLNVAVAAALLVYEAARQRSHH